MVEAAPAELVWGELISRGNGERDKVCPPMVTAPILGGRPGGMAFRSGQA